MPRRVVTQDGEYWIDDQGNPISTPPSAEMPASTAMGTNLSGDDLTYNSGSGSQSFRDRLAAAIKAAYPSKSQNQAWLDEKVNYFLGRQAAEGPQYNEDYWLKRASGWQAGGADVAEAGDYAPGGKLYDPMMSADGGAGGDWFDENAPGFEPYTAPARPDYLQGEYKAPVWNEQFQVPDAAALYADPGYQARLDAAQKAMQRSAAAKGSILSGGTQVALGREAQNLASQEYGNAFNRALGAYQSRYGQFLDAANLSQQARGVNESAYANDVTNAQNQYGLRYNAYRDAINDRFRLADYGLRATTAGAPGGL